MPLRNRAMEQVGLSVEVSAELCDTIGGFAKRCAGLSGVVIGATDDGCSIIHLDKSSADAWYQSKLTEWERDQRSIWSAVRARRKPGRVTRLTVFSGVLKETSSSHSLERF
jgi:hypothetical protein